MANSQKNRRYYWFVQWENGGLSQSFARKQNAAKFLKHFGGKGRVVSLSPTEITAPVRAR